LEKYNGNNILIKNKMVNAKKGSNSSLGSLLLPNSNNIKKKTKSYNDLQVEDYSHILVPIEFSIASYYSENQDDLTDKKVFITLASLLTDLNNGVTATSAIDSCPADCKSDPQTTRKSKTKVTKTMISLGLKSTINNIALQALKESPVTRHEFELCIRYLLYAIDNRSWIPTGRGYLDWISNFFGFLKDEKKEEFDAFYDMVSQMFGIEKDILTMDEMIYEEENST
jgi:hypothetical protein